MKFRIFTYTLLAAVFLGCDSKLDIPDPNRLSSDEYYSTEEQAVASVDAIYNTLIIDGWYQRMTPIYNDSRSDEVGSRSPWAFLTGLSNFTLPPADEGGDIFWAGHYITVNRANQALENVPNVPDLDPALTDRLLGQAYFLRGLAYFKLANQYGNPVLVLETPVGVEALYPSNEGVTKEGVYEQVKMDLEMAIDLLPTSYAGISGPDANQSGRATKRAAQALMGKVLLYEGEYAQALPFFETVITSGEFALAENYADIFSGDPALEQADPGKIFWAEFTNSTNPTPNWGGDPNVNWRQFNALSLTYSVANFFDFYPTNWLYNEMRQELTVDGNLDERYHATILSYEPEEGYDMAFGQPWPYGENDYFLKKFTLADMGGNADFSGINYPIIRYADVLLMYAECLANTGNIGAAAEYVQIVRDRANLPDRESEFAGYTLDQFMDQLAHERVMELAVESSRWFDIMRWGWLDDAQKLQLLQAHDPEFLNFTPDRKLIPIPLNEMNNNPNLVGNAAND
ncbi:RagB/SusD family nutrient uptake outer membrane protein [Roseivirga sp. BDSF3-8]|uniref:RagB/SusD family nutrient uptake outer membrane protein n=1 Tax=Roseivirga sp. BDSF3-8 TaxID=3241598 RepID=UPI003531F526